MNTIERVKSTTDALGDAEKERDPRKALKMFAALHPEAHGTSWEMGHAEPTWTAAHFVISRPKILEDLDAG